MTGGDLDYDTPTTRSEEGQPIGNGRMGSLVWTTLSALHFQINRDDVFAENSYTTSFPKQDSDYASGCGYVDINLSDAGDDVFSGQTFHQHLSLYDGLMTVQGSGVTARIVACPLHDVMAVEIDDQRPQPAAINIDLRMLRYAIQNITGKNFQLAKNHTVEYHTAEQTATSKLDIRDGNILLTQQFREGDFYDASAVAIRVVGRPSKARYLNESTVQLSAAPGKGQFTILIASAASMRPDDDAAALALAQFHPLEQSDFAAYSADAQNWWHDFWSHGFVSMHSADGQADFVAANYTYFLYLMASSSRGAYPPRFGGMLWYTNGDMRRWGSQYWWANTNAYYSNLMPANRMELLDPVFSLYSGMLDACKLAAQQQWGSQGVWIPEITFFNGPEKLPDDIAAELQELMLVKKPYDNRSAKFQWWAETKNRHNSRWNFLADGHWDHGHYVVPTKDAGIFGHCTHILCDAAKIGALFYDRYEFTQDQTWLRERAYPIIQGAAEFYRNFPNVKLGDDNKYHIYHVNNNESGWDTGDTPNEIAGMRLAFSTAIKASTRLGVDEDLRGKWQEMLDHLAPASNPGRGRRPAETERSNSPNPPATNGSPENAPRKATGGGRGGNRPFGSFVYGGPGAIPANEPEAQLKAKFLGFNALGSFIDPTGDGSAQIFRNRLRLREGPGAIDCEHIAGLAIGIHSTLLASSMADDGKPQIEVFTSLWPRSWDCAFKLLARGGFLVSSSVKNHDIEFVEIISQLGGPCRLKNPWPESKITFQRNGVAAETLQGPSLTFDTAPGEKIVLLPAGPTGDQKAASHSP
ncbi:MAG TPA: DUF5703 domain-containing protein [Pirellulales bacterium]|nr:DUF5703 domain-containing protein [Pirellulales bacterium]